MTNILQIEQLFGGYLPKKPVLKDVNISLHEGEMVGLIGLNGAGKSTTIKHILGLMIPQQGKITIKDMQLSDQMENYRSSYAYVPENPELYSELTVREHLELTAMAYGISKEEFERRSEELLTEFRMQEKADHLPSQLSKGMKQKVMIMNAFLVEPPLYIIDEPFLGLDPLAMRSLLETMSNLKKKGASFLISSHILSTIEKYCDRYVILHFGQVIGQGTLSELKAGLDIDSKTEISLDDMFYQYVTREDKRNQ